MRRLALPILLALLLLPTAFRTLPAAPGARCGEVARGLEPRHWLGCAAEGGPRRGLTGEERLLLGRPLDPNRDGARALAFLPGLSPALAAELVRDREERGPFRSVGELLRVRGIGPKRLARVTPFLALGRTPVGVAEGAE